jgi:hypothetical protein
LASPVGEAELDDSDEGAPALVLMALADWAGPDVDCAGVEADCAEAACGVGDDAAGLLG